MNALTLLPIFGFAVFIHSVVKLRREFTFFISVSTITTFLYIASLLWQLYIGAAIVFCVGTALFLYYLYAEFFSKKELSFFKTSEFLSFLIVTILLYLLLLPSYFKEWDEFTHWGLLDKYLCITNSLPIERGVIFFPQYPPGQNLFHYFFEFYGGFAENISYYANAVILSSALYCFASLSRNGFFLERLLKAIFIFLIFALGIELIYKNSWHWLYADHTLAVVFAAIMLIVYEFKSDKYLFAYLFPTVFFLAILKPYGFIFGGTIFMALVFNYISYGRDKKYLKDTFAVFIGVAAAYVSWALHLKYATSVQDQTFGLVIDGLKHSFNGDRLDRDIATLQAFGIFLLKKASVVFVVFGILIFAVTRFYKNDKTFKNIVYAFFTMLFIFLAFLLLSYLYFFSNVEGPKLASVERYTPSYIFSLLALSFFLLLKKIFEKHINIKLIFFGIITIFAFFAYKTHKELMKENLVDFRRDVAVMNIHIKAVSKVIKKDAKICVISGHFWFDQLYFNYKFLPDLKSYINVTDKGQIKITLTTDDIKKLIAEHDYIVLYDVPQDFLDTYSDIFHTKNKSVNFILLRVDKNQSGELRVEYEN